LLEKQLAKYQGEANDKHFKHLARAFKKLSK
jgi:hypothetical protein